MGVSLKKSGGLVKMWKNFIAVFVFLVLSIGNAVSSPKGRNGMPAGHPFQGSQPKHLEVINSKKQISLPRGPYLSQDSSKPRALGRKLEEKFDTEKMMRYDDFTDEDVGNIVMDAEPLEETKLQEKITKP